MNQSSKLNATFLLGTLKPGFEFSHTEVLCRLLAEEMDKHDTESEIVRLVDYNIKPGIKNDEGEGDDWPKILRKVLDSDIVIFATPIWWGIQSSLIQRVIERMDELNEHLLKTGESELAQKVGGIVITGAEDGAEHIIGNLCNFMVWNGLTMPPACSLSWLGDASKDTEESLLKKFKENQATFYMARTMARNLCFFARLLKANPIPVEKGGIKKHLAEGTVGMAQKK